MDGMQQMPHRLTLHERKALTMTGVSEVVSFEESCVVVHTDLGSLSILGRDLKLKQLSPEGGQVSVDGIISAVSYEEPRAQGGWLRRLLG